MKTILERQTPIDAAPHSLDAMADAPARHKETCVRANTPQTLRRILVPVDFTPASVHGLRRAASLAERFGSTVCLLHVVECHPFALNGGPAMMLMKEDEAITRDATEQLSRLGREELGPHLPARPLVRQGKPAREILDAAETLDADLIILAAHKRSALGRVLFGSTADQVMRHASCAVLVIPCTDEPQLEPTLWKDSEEDDDRRPLFPAAGATS